MKSSKKIAILQDVVMEWGGAEKILESLLEEYPKSNVYTLVIDKKAKEKLSKQFPELLIYHSVFQSFYKFRALTNHLSIIKPFCWLYWKSLRLDDFDIVISISSSFSSKSIRPGKFKHISFILTPPRFLYNISSDYQIMNKIPKFIVDFGLKFLRYIDIHSNASITTFVAISRTVQERVDRIYHKKSELIYPPVEIPKQVKKHFSKSYYLTISRLVKSKNVQLIVSTFTRNKLPLIVIGEGPEKSILTNMAGPNVKIVGHCSEKDKIKYYLGAKAFIYAGIEEDFGIAPVEAMSYGLPVIAYYSGGLRETVISGKTGFFFYKPTVRSVQLALDKLKINNIISKDCISQACKFSSERFKEKLHKLVTKEIEYIQISL